MAGDVAADPLEAQPHRTLGQLLGDVELLSDIPGPDLGLVELARTTHQCSCKSGTSRRATSHQIVTAAVEEYLVRRADDELTLRLAEDGAARFADLLARVDE
ncbi:hypothetical protein [Euzebya sp.]|uniref:hypothetical protein n=1 Tax=Euzebya sp. TaxID=1971409 RepID=UPI003510EE64